MELEEEEKECNTTFRLTMNNDGETKQDGRREGDDNRNSKYGFVCQVIRSSTFICAKQMITGDKDEECFGGNDV